MTADAPPPPARPVSLAPILAVNFIGALGFSLVLPFLVFLVTRWGGNALVYGVIGATYSAFQLVGAPVLGRWSDRFGRRKILLLSQLGTFASWLLFLGAFALPLEPALVVDSGALGTFRITPPLVAVFLARAVDGLTGGNVSVANAYLADLTRETDRSTNFGRMAVAANLGFIFGPALAGLLGSTRWGELVPVAAAAAISAAATVVIAFRLPESRPCVLAADPEPTSVRRTFGQEPRPCIEMKGAPRLTARQVLALPGVVPLLAVQFLVMLGFSLYYVGFPVHAVRALTWTVGETGIYFSVMAVLLVVVEGPVLAWTARRVADRTLVTAGSAVLAAGFALFASTRDAFVYGGVALLALGNGLMWPSVAALTSRAAGERHQGAVQGFAGASAAVASILGLVVGGFLYGLLGGGLFLVSALVILAVAATSLGIRASEG